MSRNTSRRVSDQSLMRSATEPELRLIRLHCDFIRRTGATPATIGQRRDALRRLARRLPVPLTEATAAHLDAWQAGLTVSLSSVATYSSHTRGFYRWAVDSGHIEHDPSARLPQPKVPPRRARPIPEQDLNVAIECAPEPHRTWLLLGAFMGLRAAEIAGIRREDVTDVDGRLIVGGVGKGQKPFRLPVPAELEPYFRGHLHSGTGPLWRTSTGRPVTARHVSGRMSDFFDGLGMPYTLHCARHSFGTAMYRSTRDLLVTQESMRHSSADTTRLYVETVRSEVVVAMDRLSKQLAWRGSHKSTDRPPPKRGRAA